MSTQERKASLGEFYGRASSCNVASTSLSPLFHVHSNLVLKVHEFARSHELGSLKVHWYLSTKFFTELRKRSLSMPRVLFEPGLPMLMLHAHGVVRAHIPFFTATAGWDDWGGRP
jgi:hypothetical protein